MYLSPCPEGNPSSTVELDINNSLSSQLNVAMNGSLKAPMPLIKTKGQEVKEQAEEAAKAEAARKEQAAQRAGLGVGKLIGAALLGLAAVAVIGAATAMTGGLALAVLGPTLAPMAAVAMQVTGVALAAAAISDGIEGAQDIAYAAKGDLDSHAYNPLRDGVFGGDAEAYANFETGLMILAALELEFAAPFVIAQQVQAQANRQAMQKSRAGVGVSEGSSAATSIHPGKLAAESTDVSHESVMRALRQSGSREGYATAAMLKRGKITMNFADTHPQGWAGEYKFGEKQFTLYRDQLKSPTNAAGYAAHETKHYLQKITPQTYRRIHEFDAYQWQRSVDKGFGLTNEQIWNHINTHPAYKNVLP